MEDGRIDENMLALSIGLTTTGVYGLARAVNSEQWYRNIILHDSLYSCEQLLEFVYPELAKQNSWKLPVWYYISKSNMKSELAEEKAPHSYTEIVTESTIKRNRSAIGERTAWEVWTQEKDNLMKAIRLLGCMPEEKIDVTLLNCDTSKVTSLFIKYFESLPETEVISAANMLISKFVQTEILYTDFSDQISLSLAFIMCYNRSEEFCKMLGTDMVIIKEIHADAVRKSNDEKEKETTRELVIAKSIAASVKKDKK